MENYIQDNRVIAIETLFGKDVLLLYEMDGAEAISDLFEFDLSMHSTNHGLPLDALIGENATVSIRLPDGSVRFVNGIVSEFRHSGTFLLRDGRDASLLSHYEAKLVPWFWALKLNRDCRIFQNKNVPEIVREIFGEHSSASFQMRLTGDYPRREYCVQYRESDFDFISRLLEEEGIFYFFEHSESDHKLILSDSPVHFRPSPFHPLIDFTEVAKDDLTEAVISKWQAGRQMRSERFELKDFNFRNPTLDLTANLAGSKNPAHQLEVYDYPGEYESREVGEKIVRVRYEEEKSREVSILAKTNGRGFQAGFQFKLQGHPRLEFNRDYVVLKIEHRASSIGAFRSGDNSEAFSYECRLSCLPHPTNFRPTRKSPIPKIQGTQTAIVVGPKGEEIFVDKHGRVKVQFHWDRIGKRNEKSSCWIRVSQPWAGTGFGGITIPRIGQEVIVDFLEGDPDRPIITGRVYNGASMPPYELPANKAHSGLMSRSTPGGGSENFNGIRMDDGVGAEMMQIQAEKDEDILVKNDKSETVGNNETIEIGVDRSENVGNNESLTVGNDQQISIGNNRSEDVGNNESVKIGNNRNTTVSSNDVLSVGLTRTHSVGINEAINIGAAQEVSIGAVQIVSVGIAQINNIGLKQKTSAGKEISLSAPRIVLTATEELTLKCGAGIITFDAAGNITIKAPLVKINT
ncbi:MAG: type VI secretion system tip protein VgrG [Acidobacteria bacterium]|nr:type VI secretion system tip protein VgrG [Acidobacteriota bacterium]